jgi:trehalose 6-phosphate synthase/phosphatase
MPILAKYTARSNGSFIKLTHSSIGWSYYSCDPEWGSLQASHLVLELEQALRAFDVRFVMIKGIVEVVPRILNKGLIVKQVLREVHLRGHVDFILCMGDDIQDEKMFTVSITITCSLLIKLLSNSTVTNHFHLILSYKTVGIYISSRA